MDFEPHLLVASSFGITFKQGTQHGCCNKRHSNDRIAAFLSFSHTPRLCTSVTQLTSPIQSHESVTLLRMKMLMSAFVHAHLG